MEWAKKKRRKKIGAENGGWRIGRNEAIGKAATARSLPRSCWVECRGKARGACQANKMVGPTRLASKIEQQVAGRLWLLQGVRKINRHVHRFREGSRKNLTSRYLCTHQVQDTSMALSNGTKWAREKGKVQGVLLRNRTQHFA